MNGMPMVLYDTPGLGDSQRGADEQHLKQINDLLDSGAVHITVYCIKMTETRMQASLIHTFKEYTQIGIDWKFVVFALTFADVLPYPRGARSDSYQKAKYFVKRTQQWKQCIGETLVGIDATVAQCIKVYPSSSRMITVSVNRCGIKSAICISYTTALRCIWILESRPKGAVAMAAGYIYMALLIGKDG